jgi:hypothetical protein
MSVAWKTPIASTWLRILALALVAACGKAGATDGKERGPCYGNGTCDVGLACMSDRCVRPPPADCDKVGAKLASYRLGNYAAREERDRVIAELAGACRAAQLSVDEGKCILDAQSRVDVARCPRPVLDELKADPKGCRAAAEALTGLFSRLMVRDDATREQAQPLLGELTDVMTVACTEDLWSDAAKQCIGRAKVEDDLEACEDTLTKEQRDRAEERFDPIIERIQALQRN